MPTEWLSAEWLSVSFQRCGSPSITQSMRNCRPSAFSALTRIARKSKNMPIGSIATTLGVTMPVAPGGGFGAPKRSSLAPNA